MDHNPQPEPTITQSYTDTFSTIATEFNTPRNAVKTVLLGILADGRRDQLPGESLLGYCRRKLISRGWKPVPPKPTMKIRFKRDVELYIYGNALHYGAMSEEEFERGQEIAVTSVTPEAPPSSDMSAIVFPDGRRASCLNEDFELVPETAT